MPNDDQRRKFKGRVVFQGYQAKRPHTWEAAMLQELDSPPALMDANRATDVNGLMINREAPTAGCSSCVKQGSIAMGCKRWPDIRAVGGLTHGVALPSPLMWIMRHVLDGLPDSYTDW